MSLDQPDSIRPKRGRGRRLRFSWFSTQLDTSWDLLSPPLVSTKPGQLRVDFEQISFVSVLSTGVPKVNFLRSGPSGAPNDGAIQNYRLASATVDGSSLQFLALIEYIG